MTDRIISATLGLDSISASSVMSLYLYGTIKPPELLYDRLKPLTYVDKLATVTVIDLFGIETKVRILPVTISAREYMESGPGRFANGAGFELVRVFFDGLSALSPGSYSIDDILSAAGGGLRNQLSVEQVYKNDTREDYNDRSFIYNNTSFTIKDSAALRFIVSESGERYVENLEVRPFDDNFDFDGGSLLSAIFNLVFKSCIDPNEIGTRVEFIYDHSNNNVDERYTREEFDSDTLFNKFSTINEPLSSPEAFVSGLEASGILNYQIGNFKVIYGKPIAEKTSSGFFGFGGEPTLFLAGDGDDVLGGSSSADRAYGHRGNDQIIGNGGDDLLFGGSGSDTINGNDGKDHLYGDFSAENFHGAEEPTGTAGNDFLYAGSNDDWLIGGAGDDLLNGGNGRDVAVFTGTALDYDVRQNSDSSWTVRHVRGSADQGTDTLKNIEIIEFDGGVQFELKKKGLPFQTDFALVIDTTGSMGSSINAVKQQAAALINAAFSDGRADARIGIVGFKDTTEGEPSEVLLRFTDQDSFAERKGAALAAINAIRVDGGGDAPETGYDGLRVALDGTMGQWRGGAAILRIAFFTDAPIKDVELAALVTELARSIGATITVGSSIVGSNGLVSTFELSSAAVSSPTLEKGHTDDELLVFVPDDTPITPDTSTAQVQIFTIYTGRDGGDVDAIRSIAEANGGSFFDVDDSDELVRALFEIINLPPTGQPPVAADDAFSMLRTGALAGNLLGDNGSGADADPDSSSLAVVAKEFVTASGGSVQVSADGAFTYAPARGFIGTDTFEYVVSDIEGLTDTGLVSIAVSARPGDILGTDDADLIRTGSKAQVLFGMGGNDVLSSGSGDDEIYGGDGADAISGGSGNDFLDGGDGNDTLSGNSGRDTLNGGAGADTIFGSSGNDTIIGGFGADHLEGGSGADRFVYVPGEVGTGVDLIEKFSARKGDKIDLTDIFPSFTRGTDALADFVRTRAEGSNTIIEVDLDGGGDSFEALAILIGVRPTGTDWILI